MKLERVLQLQLEQTLPLRLEQVLPFQLSVPFASAVPDRVLLYQLSWVEVLQRVHLLKLSRALGVPRIPPLEQVLGVPRVLQLKRVLRTPRVLQLELVARSEWKGRLALPVLNLEHRQTRPVRPTVGRRRCYQEAARGRVCRAAASGSYWSGWRCSFLGQGSRLDRGTTTMLASTCAVMRRHVKFAFRRYSYRRRNHLVISFTCDCHQLCPMLVHFPKHLAGFPSKVKSPRAKRLSTTRRNNSYMYKWQWRHWL